MSSLDLALVGNGTIGALVSPLSEVVWGCFPHFDGDPAFCSLLRQRTHESDFGFFVVELSDVARAEQEYLVNTPMLVTRLYDRAGAAVEITDFAPRFHQYGRMFCPMMLVRQIKRIAGNPRIRVRLRPARDYGRAPAETTCGSNHIRYASTDLVLRLTTDAAISALVEENPFYLEDAVTLLLGPDETVQGAVAAVGRRFFEETAAYWRGSGGAAALPFRWAGAPIPPALTPPPHTFQGNRADVAGGTTPLSHTPRGGRG